MSALYRHIRLTEEQKKYVSEGDMFVCHGDVLLRMAKACREETQPRKKSFIEKIKETIGSAVKQIRMAMTDNDGYQRDY